MTHSFPHTKMCDSGPCYEWSKLLHAWQQFRNALIHSGSLRQSRLAAMYLIYRRYLIFTLHFNVRHVRSAWLYFICTPSFCWKWTWSEHPVTIGGLRHVMRWNVQSKNHIIYLYMTFQMGFLLYTSFGYRIPYDWKRQQLETATH